MLCIQKVNCVRGIPSVQCIQQKTVIGTTLKRSRILSERNVPFSENRQPFSYGLQSSPFLYVFTVFLQMLTNDVLHKA